MLREKRRRLKAGRHARRLAAVRAARRDAAPGPGEDQHSPFARARGRGSAAHGQRFASGRPMRSARPGCQWALSSRRLRGALCVGGSARPPLAAASPGRAGVPSPSKRPGVGVALPGPAAGPAQVGMLGPAPPGGWGPCGRCRFKALRGDEPAFSTSQRRGRRARLAAGCARRLSLPLARRQPARVPAAGERGGSPRPACPVTGRGGVRMASRPNGAGALPGHSISI